MDKRTTKQDLLNKTAVNYVTNPTYRIVLNSWDSRSS